MRDLVRGDVVVMEKKMETTIITFSLGFSF